MPKILIILIIFFTVIYTNACDLNNLNFSKYYNYNINIISTNFISAQIIIDYFQKNNLCIRINNQNLLESDIKKLYKYLRAYINKIYWENYIYIPKNKILEIIVNFDEKTREFDFEFYFSEKEIYSDILYVWFYIFLMLIYKKVFFYK